MKTIIILSIATASLVTLSSCCGPSVSKRLPNLPDAPVVAPSTDSAPIYVTPTK